MMLKIKRLLAGLVSLLLIAMATPMAGAQSTNGLPTGSGLSITPTVSEFTIKPGDSNTVKITLKNVTVDNVTAVSYLNDFVADNATGNPKIITDPNVHSPNSLRNFIVGLQNVPLQRDEQKNLTVGLQVPANTPPGAYYGIIRYRAVPENSPLQSNGGQVSLTASVGTIVLVTVPGKLREQVQLSAVHVYRGARDSSFFVTKPDKIGVEIRNLGNGFEKPFGTVEVQNTFGKVVGTYQFNNPQQLGNVLPNSSRTFTSPFNKINKIGRYKITANVSYGNGSQVLSLTKTVWYIPAWLAIALAVVILALLYLVFRAYRRYNRDKRHSYRE
jgi:hypothetical protein